MKIAQELLQDFLELNDDQREIVTHESGPLLVVAGPGSGKTQSLILLAMNLLLLDKAKPSELILCTYTEKAAYEMQDRISAIARKAGYHKDISEIRIDTIHGICNRIIMENLHRIRTPGNNYETLDELSQRLFIFEYLDAICESNTAFFLNRWGTRWKTAKELQRFFERMTEEFVDVNVLSSTRDYFLHNLAKAYCVYRKLLVDYNRVDFAHLQKIVYHLLNDPKFSPNITKNIRYVLVDEYQDTNYIQEQILTRLVSETKNICVVGDEDQALYRFRGATVRNILKFRDTFPYCKEIHLTINYRSHHKIIDAYNNWMASINWNAFRFNKMVKPGKEFEQYPAVISLFGRDSDDEAHLFAEFVAFLKEQRVVTDYNQIALLMYSVKTYKSDVYIKALEEKGIPVFCPRAGTYFEEEEICLMVGCFARIFGYSGGLLSDVVGHYQIHDYLKRCYAILALECESSTTLEATLQELETEILGLSQGQKLDKRIADYFYRLLATEPFATFVKHEKKMSNLVIFSQLLSTFQSYYHCNDISYENREELTSYFFNRFLSLLYEDGIKYYEDPERPFPKGCVQILTIHQAKGLEFPVIVVGSLDRKPSDIDEVDRRLQNFYRRSQTEQSEPENLIPLFDFMRLYYVAFSRAMNLLVLTGNQRRRPTSYFDPIRQRLPQWPFVGSSLLNIQPFPEKRWTLAKRRYSFTGHIRMYETCPRQYQFYREYNFTPSRSPDTFFGLLVHQTIEKIHRIVLGGPQDRQIAILTELKIRNLFEQTFFFLSNTDMPLIDASEKEKAFEQVMNYFLQNQLELYRVIKTEENISVVKEQYILTGKIDLIMQVDGKLEVLDFKTSKRQDNPELLDAYERQLHMYAHALEQRDGRRPERLLLYWTEEPRKEKALMVFPYQSEMVEDTVSRFTAVVNKIEAKEFVVTNPPEPHICNKCDIRNLCIRERLIELP
jgi:DNA helicase II / ATP-dependent DNA helicase PcrA